MKKADMKKSSVKKSNVKKSDIIPSIEGDIRPDFIPANRYTASDIPTLEHDTLWPRIWHIACREEEIPKVGDYVTYEIFNESIIIVRTSKTEVKALYTVCAHRGRRLVDPGSGHVTNFFCRFHGWKYDLEGKNTHVFHPEAWEGCPEFTEENLSLKSPKLDTWGGWIWVNMDENAEPLADWLGKEFLDTMEPFDIPSMRRAWYKTIIAPVNWKVVIEAFIEGYHSGATHSSWMDYYQMRANGAVHGNHAMYFTVFEDLPKAKKENGRWSKIKSTRDLIYYQCKELHETLFAMVTDPIMKAATRLRDECPATMDDVELYQRFFEIQREEIEATGAKWPKKLNLEAVGKAGTSWHLFPNTIFLPGADGILWYRVRPHHSDPDQCVFDIWSLQRYAPGKEPKIKQVVANGWKEAAKVNAFLAQDFANMSAVNEGMKSRGWVGARLNPAEEITIRHFHEMLDKYFKKGKA